MAQSSATDAPDALAGEVAAAYGALPQVVAVAMAGSRATGAGDGGSDLDLYAYAHEPLPLRDREAVAARFASRREIGNVFWEPGDEWVDAGTGLHVDVMHRTPAWIEEQLERVLVRHEVSVGYSTCFWHNVVHSTALFDRSGWYRALQAAADRPYPQELKRAIVAKNHPILRRSLSSYTRQIERAARRGDSVSVQHRVSALLASYFDILFAVNELPHPGEKGVLSFAATRCPTLPEGMETAVDALLAIPAWAAPPAVLEPIAVLLTGLDAVLASEGLLRGHGAS